MILFCIIFHIIQNFFVIFNLFLQIQHRMLKKIIIAAENVHSKLQNLSCQILVYIVVYDLINGTTLTDEWQGEWQDEWQVTFHHEQTLPCSSTNQQAFSFRSGYLTNVINFWKTIDDKCIFNFILVHYILIVTLFLRAVPFIDNITISNMTVCLRF